MDQAVRGSLLDRLSALDDPRQAAKVLYPLPEIILLLLVRDAGRGRRFCRDDTVGRAAIWRFLRHLRPYAHGFPSHNTLGEVIRAVDPNLFKGCFASWMEGLRTSQPDILTSDVIAIDGKTSRRTQARKKGREPLHAGAARASRQRLDLPPGKWTPGYAVFRSACSGVM